MHLVDLDDKTRAAMVEELDRDLAAGPGTGKLFIGARLTQEGVAMYPALLREAALHGNTQTLTDELTITGRLKLQETASNPRGGPDIIKAVPSNAASVLAEGEFGRFYARAICVRAIAEQGPGATVTVYRARNSEKPRPESLRLENTTVSAAALLADLRLNVGVDTALGIPPGPNSGLSVRL